jgi:hypothetical protein
MTKQLIKPTKFARGTLIVQPNGEEDIAYPAYHVDHGRKGLYNTGQSSMYKQRRDLQSKWSKEYRNLSRSGADPVTVDSLYNERNADSYVRYGLGLRKSPSEYKIQKPPREFGVRAYYRMKSEDDKRLNDMSPSRRERYKKWRKEKNDERKRDIVHIEL